MLLQIMVGALSGALIATTTLLLRERKTNKMLYKALEDAEKLIRMGQELGLIQLKGTEFRRSSFLPTKDIHPFSRN